MFTEQIILIIAVLLLLTVLTLAGISLKLKKFKKTYPWFAAIILLVSVIAVLSSLNSLFTDLYIEKGFFPVAALCVVALIPFIAVTAKYSISDLVYFIKKIRR